MMMMRDSLCRAGLSIPLLSTLLFLDEKGAKMSKSKGNVIDPLTMVDKYGSDTLRFTLASLATPGQGYKVFQLRS